MVDTSQDIFAIQLREWSLGPLGAYKFVASAAQIHLFAITCFVSIVAPLGSFFVSGLKRALKLE